MSLDLNNKCSNSLYNHGNATGATDNWFIYFSRNAWYSAKGAKAGHDYFHRAKLQAAGDEILYTILQPRHIRLSYSFFRGNERGSRGSQNVASGKLARTEISLNDVHLNLLNSVTIEISVKFEK